MGGTDIFSFSQVSKQLYDISKNTSGYKIGYGDYLIQTYDYQFEDIQRELYGPDAGSYISGTELKMYAVKMLRKHLETHGAECTKKTKKCVQTSMQDIEKLRCAVIELREKTRLRDTLRVSVGVLSNTTPDTSSCDSNCEHPIYQDHNLAHAWEGVIKMNTTVTALMRAMNIFPSFYGRYGADLD